MYRRHIRSFQGGGDAPLFEAVFFELRTRCNGQCSFCAASVQNDQRPDQTMPFDLFRKVVEDLADLDYSGRVAFHVHSDPLMVQNLDRYVGFAREKLPQAWLQILTNGKALNDKRGNALLGAGINELTVNHYTDDLAAPLPTNIVQFREEIIPRYYSSEEVAEGYGPDGGPAVFRFNINRRRQTEVLTNRAGTAPNKVALTGENVFGFCVYPFTQLNITVDGEVSMCCHDFFFQEAVGNVRDRSVMEIWHGAPFRRVRDELLRNDRSRNRICRRCDFFGVRTSSFSSWLERLLFTASKNTASTE